MKIIILGALIASLFLAAAQSISVNRYNSGQHYKVERANASGSVSDTGSIYAVKQGIRPEIVQPAVVMRSR